MLSVLSCITVEHDLSLVTVAAVLCAFGSWVTSRLYRHSLGRTQRQALAWQVWTGVTAGISIWSTHFVAMLGFRPNVPVSFDLGLTFASLLIAVIGSTIGIVMAQALRTRFAPYIGGAVLGLAISAMHYAGMIAYRVQGFIFWDETYLTASIILAVVLSAAALHLGHQARRWSGEMMAGVLALAIVTLHFTGMTAFGVAPQKISGDYINAEALHVLALAIAGTAGLIVLGGLFSYVVEKRSRQESIAQLIEARNAAEAASLAKSEFMSVLSHELRTPLTVVLGYADMLTNIRAGYQGEAAGSGNAQSEAFDTIGEQAELYGSRIQTAGNHLLTLINEILDYSSMELSDLTLSKSTFSFRDMLMEARQQFAASAEEKGVTITLACDNIHVVADRARCLQIVLNLVGNALKFSESPEIVLRARIDQADLLFSVEDRGQGIESEHLDRIFVAFQQIETADHRSQGGTGLGLAVCKKLAIAHGGDIFVDSAPGCGATFTVVIPGCVALAPVKEFTAVA